MAGKRANNDGSIYKRADGRWTAAITVECGKRKQFYGRTRTEVQQKLIKAQADQQRATHSPINRGGRIGNVCARCFAAPT